MNPSLATLLIAAGAYLLGSVSFAVVVSKLYGLPDPHSYGSGNPGATNVLRTGNRSAAALTLVGDGIKGWFAVWIAQRLGANWGDASLAATAAALAVVIGHLFPLYHRFSGGKGVATAAGVCFALSWQLAVALLVVWGVLAATFRISSLAALGAAAAAPLLALYFIGNRPEAWVLFPIAALLFWRHRENIRKLLAGTERKIGH
ncbi:MAG TPA: glycerol-3-phosphate 1-O-acyltransferase PlsY [Casimicrobiaceae bacterium]